MTKLEIQAIQAFPRKYVRDGVNIASYAPSGSKPMVFACHALLPPIIFCSKLKKWKRMRFEKAPVVHNFS